MSYEIQYHEKIPLRHVDTVINLFDEYLKELRNDNGETLVEGLCGLVDKVGICLMYHDNDIGGFYIVSKEFGVGDQKPFCFVHHFFIRQKYKKTQLLRLGEGHLIDFMMRKKLKVNKIFFSTKRDSIAFKRMLRGNWLIDSVVLKLCA